MGRYIGPVCRLCRRQGEKLMLKGDRCDSRKCTLERRTLPPGQQRPRRRRLSDRGLQLREKQRARYTYGVMERQFFRHFTEAQDRPGITGEILLQILETRLDNVVYRLGFASSRNQARQLVRHGHITVNGHRTDIPSYTVKVSDAIGWYPKSIETEYYKIMVESIKSHVAPQWLSFEAQALVGRVLSLPGRSDVDAAINERAVVEYYSR